jgi:hypothetical protein
MINFDRLEAFLVLKLKGSYLVVRGALALKQREKYVEQHHSIVI